MQELGPAHYGAAGMKLLSLPVPDAARLCDLAKNSLDPANLESAHHAAAVAALSPGCDFVGAAKEAQVGWPSLCSVVRWTVDDTALLFPRLSVALGERITRES